MEGALPSVVGGIVAGPVIAVPTSIGYGVSFGGLAALAGMLSSCASGVVVCNIDNGFGAAYAAARILRGARAVLRTRASGRRRWDTRARARPRAIARTHITTAHGTTRARPRARPRRTTRTRTTPAHAHDRPRATPARRALRARCRRRQGALPRRAQRPRGRHDHRGARRPRRPRAASIADAVAALPSPGFHVHFGTRVRSGIVATSFDVHVDARAADAHVRRASAPCSTPRRSPTA